MGRFSLRRARSSTLARNMVALYGAHVVSLLVPLITIPYLARVLRPTGWGLVVFTQSFAAWLILVVEYAFDLSGTRVVVRARPEQAKLERIVASVQGAKLIVLIPVTVMTIVSYAVIPAFRENGQYLLWAWIFASAKGLSPFWYFLGVERVRAPAGVESGGRILAALGVFVFVTNPEDGWIVVALQAGGSALSTLLLTYWLYREVSPRWPRWREALRILRDTATIFVTRISSGAYIQANSFILGLLTTTQVVGFFGGAEKVVRAGVNLLHPLTQAIFPRLNHLFSTDPPAARRMLRACLLAMVGLGSVLGSACFFGARPLVSILLGPGYEATVPVLRVMALLPPIVAVGSVFGIHWALPMGLDRPFMLLVLLAGALNIVLAILLAPRYGAMGMAVSVVLADVVVSAGLVAVFRREARAPSRVAA